MPSADPSGAGPALPSATSRLVVIVLAGGESRRFGSDKLATALDGRRLLDHALDGLPSTATIGLVGPVRPVERAVAFLREDPPGGGPAAGLVAGLRWGLEQGSDLIATLPGDAPSGGRAAVLLADVLRTAETESAVGVDGDGREQVLQLALRPRAARALLELAGPGAGHGQSVRRLVAALSPPPHRVPLSPDLVQDIDTVAELRHFRNRSHA